MRTSLFVAAVALLGSTGCAVHAGRYRPAYYGYQQPTVVYQQPQPVVYQQPAVVYQQPVYQQPVYQQPVVLQAPPPVYCGIL